MADPNCDCCNVIAEAFKSFIAWLEQIPATLFPPPPPSAPTSLRPPFLREPDFQIREHSRGFQVGKPNYGIFDTTLLPSAPLTVIKNDFATRAEAEKFVRGIPTIRRGTPRVRLPKKLQDEVLSNGSKRSLPASEQFDWTTDLDAKNIDARLQSFLNQIPLALTRSANAARDLAILPDGEVAQTRPDPANPTPTLVLIDPFQISQGMLELCAVYIHELTHVDVFQRRGFVSDELAPLLALNEFLLVSLDEELSCFKNEVTAVQQFVALVPAGSRPSFTRWVDTAISAPAKLYFASGLAAMAPATVEQRTHKIIGDEYRLDYEQYYNSARGSLVPSAAANAWISSPEWTAIQATLPAWQAAGVLP
jgi:hypothetical protein